MSNVYPGSDFPGLSSDESLWGLSPTALEPWALGPDAALEHEPKSTHMHDAHMQLQLHMQLRHDQPAPSMSAAQTDPFRLARSVGGGGVPARRSWQARNRNLALGGDNSTGTGSTSFWDNTPLERAKREKFLERNRLAASKCRQKKKEHTMQLETQFKTQADKKEMLVAEIAHLRSELLSLKNEVLKHAQCGDEPIKLHLAQMVKKIAYNDAVSVNASAADGAAAATAPTSTAEQDAPAALAFGIDSGLHLPLVAAASMAAASVSTPALASAAACASNLEQRLPRESDTDMPLAMSSAASSGFDDLINV